MDNSNECRYISMDNSNECRYISMDNSNECLMTYAIVNKLNLFALSAGSSPQGYKTFFMGPQTEHENYPANKC